MNENFENQNYIESIKLEDARTNFRLCCSMLRTIKMNQKSNEVFARQLWSCDHCGKIDSQSHIMWCPSLVALREGLEASRSQSISSSSTFCDSLT